MALLLNIDYNLNHILNVHLVFDDKSEKNATFETGNVYTVTYNNLGTLITITGLLSKIITPNTIREPYDTRPKQFILEFDCSDDFKSKKVRINVGDIRDVDVEAEGLDQNGITFDIDTLTENDKYMDSKIIYNNGTSEIRVDFDINSKSIDPDTADYLLDISLEKYKEKGVLPAEVSMNIIDWPYKDATHYSINYEWSEGAFVAAGEELIPITDNKIIVGIPMMNIYYRLNENDSWIHGSNLPDISDTVKTARDQLVSVTGIRRDRMSREYGYLFRFEPPISGTVLRIRCDFFKNNSTIGVEYLKLVFNNTIKPEAIIVNINDTGLEVGESKQLYSKILPENAPVPTIYYFSENENVVTVDKYTGLLTAVSDGYAQVTAVAADDKYITKNLYVSVSTVLPDFSIIANTMSVNGGESKIVPIGYSDGITPDTLTVEVDNGNIVRAIASDINNIAITGMTEGSTYITLRANKVGYNMSEKVVRVICGEYGNIDVETETEFVNAISDPTINKINFSGDITSVSNSIFIDRPVTINGNNNTISFTSPEIGFDLSPNAAGTVIENLTIVMGN